MSKLKFLLILLPAVFLILSMESIRLMAVNYVKAEFMQAADAEKRWSRKEFSAKKFSKAKIEERGPMAVDALLKRLYVGKSILKDVRKDLGTPDGYFFSDTIIGYQLNNPTSSDATIWQLIFIPDESLSRVKEVKIHKKCCY